MKFNLTGVAAALMACLPMWSQNTQQANGHFLSFAFANVDVPIAGVPSTEHLSSRFTRRLGWPIFIVVLDGDKPSGMARQFTTETISRTSSL
jgi:hypothetical protein